MIHSAFASVENLWLDIPVGPGIQILGYKQKLTFLGDFFSLSLTHTLAFFPFFFFIAAGGERDKTKQKNNKKQHPPLFIFKSSWGEENKTTANQVNPNSTPEELKILAFFRVGHGIEQHLRLLPDLLADLHPR